MKAVCLHPLDAALEAIQALETGHIYGRAILVP